MQQVEVRRLTKFTKWISDDEFTNIQKYISTIKSPPSIMVLKIMMFMGLRVGDTVRLRRENFSPDWKMLRYFPLKQKHPKLQERHVPGFLRDELAYYWQRWSTKGRKGVCYCRRTCSITRVDEHGAFLFFPFNGHKTSHLHMTVATIGMRFYRLRQALGLKDVYDVKDNGVSQHRVSPHVLRHHFLHLAYEATGSLPGGKDLKLVQDVIGHADINMTASYIKDYGKRLKEKDLIELIWKQDKRA